ncbi:MAG: ASKHA domain-containing protein [Acidiferrobacterales bacterium]
MSKTVQITFVNPDSNADSQSTQVIPGESILRVAHDAGVEIPATCGGRGRCRSCRVKVLKGDIPPPTVQDTVQLGHEEVHERFRLSCQTKVIADCTIMPLPLKAEIGHQILGVGTDAASDRVSLDSGVQKRIIVAKPPMEEHHQTSDVEEIVSVFEENIDPVLPLHVVRKVPRALREKNGQLTVTTFNNRVIDVEAGDTTAQQYGLAFDIGTTSIVGSLIDLNSGEQLAAVGGVNPQAVYGGDLMSRIAFAQFDAKKLNTLRARALTAINDFIKEACEQAAVSAEHIYKIVIVGNTCMHHIFLAIDTSYVGLAPYAPTMRDPIVVSAAELPLKAAPNAQICFLPIVAGFVGADTIAAVLATRVYDSDGIRVVVDIGTNGEVVMGSRRKLMACSAPAGPALEGGQISHGMRGAVGAIEQVHIGEDVECNVIGDVPPIGICGSGLIDAAAKMLDLEILDKGGRFSRSNHEQLPPAIRGRFVGAPRERAFVLAWADHAGKNEDITLTQIDIRQLQFAKGAIFAGILMLQKLMHVADGQIEELLLCGGFGNYINIESAVRIRLLPPLALERITYVGNAAHLGAQMALLSETERQRAANIAQEIEHVALATAPEFQEIFVDACNLEVDERLQKLGKG